MKILFPTNFTQIADNAFDYLIGIVRNFENFDVHLLHVAREEFSNRDAFDSMVQEIEKIGGKAIIELRVGFLEDVIEELASDLAIDLIITGTHGASNLDKHLFGTHSTDLFDKVNCPILLIPATVKYRANELVIYASDYQVNDNENLKSLCKLMNKINMKLLIVHINTSSERYFKEEELMERFVQDINIEKWISNDRIAYKVVSNKNVVEGLKEIILNFKADMLVMSTFRRNLLGHYFDSSITKQLAYEINTPLMIYHLKENKHF